MADLLDIEDVLTHAQLDLYVGGQLEAQMHLLSSVWADGDASEKLREWALDEVLLDLAERVPPIREADIAIPAELHRAARHKAAERMYDVAMTGGGDAELWHAKMRTETKRYGSVMGKLSPTVADGVQAPSGAGSVGLSRR